MWQWHLNHISVSLTTNIWNQYWFFKLKRHCISVLQLAEVTRQHLKMSKIAWVFLSYIHSTIIIKNHKTITIYNITILLTPWLRFPFPCSPALAPNPTPNPTPNPASTPAPTPAPTTVAITTTAVPSIFFFLMIRRSPRSTCPSRLFASRISS